MADVLPKEKRMEIINITTFHSIFLVILTILILGILKIILMVSLIVLKEEYNHEELKTYVLQTSKVIMLTMKVLLVTMIIVTIMLILKIIYFQTF